MYGAVRLDSFDVARTREVVSPSSRSFLALLPEGVEPDPETFAAAGWRVGLRDFEELAIIAGLIAARNGVLIRQFGEFDDPDVGVDLISGGDLYDKISSMA